MTHRRVLTAGLVVLGLLNLGWGVWALVAPRRFFDTFPGFGPGWTAAYPPFNAHLVNDLGATFTTLGVLLLIAAALGDRRVTLVVLTGTLVFSVIHLAFHATHAGELTGAPLAASLTALAFGVAVPGGLLLSAWRGRA